MTPEQTETGATLGTDEEHDWNQFRTYLHELTPEGLWDAFVHVDADRFPRRRETIEREMTRRGLFFVSPYTDGEQKVRLLSLNLIGFALLALVTHHIPTVTTLINQAAIALRNETPVLSPTGRAVSLVSGLTDRETSVLNALTDVFGGIAVILLTVLLVLLPFLMMRFHRRALHGDLMGLAWISLFLGAALLWLLRV